MSHIPAISTVIAPHYVAVQVAKHFGLSPKVTAKILRVGVNHTYLIEGEEGRYVYRIYTYNWRSKEEIQAEIDYLDAMAALGLQVSTAIKDKDGNYLHEYPVAEGTRYGLLFTWCDGKILRKPDLPTCERLGQIMARMHQYSQNKQAARRTYDAQSLLGWAAEQVEAHFGPANKQVQYLHRAAERFAERMQAAPAEQLRAGIVHLDMGYGNLKIQEDGDIALFDFDNLGNGWLFLDIAYTIMIMFRQEEDKQQYEQKAAAFLRGYEGILPVTPEEKALIPWGGMAIWLHYSGVHALRFQDFTSVFFDEYYFSYWVSFIDQWLQYHDIKI